MPIAHDEEHGLSTVGPETLSGKALLIGGSCCRIAGREGS